MFNPKLYHELCRELRAPEEKIEEIIAMTEQNKKSRRRVSEYTAAAFGLFAARSTGWAGG